MLPTLCRLLFFSLILHLALPSVYSSSSSRPTKDGKSAPSHILVWMPYASRSIQMNILSLSDALGQAGHLVTVVKPPTDIKASHPNVRMMLVEKAPFEKTAQEISVTMLREQKYSPLSFISKMAWTGVVSQDFALSQPSVQQLIRNTHFDLVMTSTLLANEVGYYLAHLNQAHLAFFCTIQSSIHFMDHAMGQPHNPAYLPLPSLNFGMDMNFKQRVINSVANFVSQHIVRDWYILSQLEDLLDRHFPEDTDRPRLLDLERNASLALHMGHPLLMDGLRPMAPNFVPVGMMTCRPGKKLPEDLQTFLDSAKDGAALIAFGSILNTSIMPSEKRRIFLEVLGQFPKHKFLWKWEDGEMKDDELPANVKLSRWLPQQDVLAHPNVKVFITHVGQSSFQETLCHQKPVVAIPINADQVGNAFEVERLGIGKIASTYNDLAMDTFKQALEQVLQDPEYTRQARTRGAMIMDQMNSPMDRAVWWVEFLLRHRGSGNPFRSPVHDLAWYQYFLLDVLLFLTGLVLGVVILVTYLVRWICCRSRSAKNKKE